MSALEFLSSAAVPFAVGNFLRLLPDAGLFTVLVEGQVHARSGSIYSIK